MQRQSPVKAALIFAAVLALVAPGGVLAVTPTNGAAFAAFSVVTINAGAGDQYDPHVDGDDVSYTSNGTVRYYSFVTGDDDAITVPAGYEDQLSDVSNGIVAFSRFDTSTFATQARIFEIASGKVGFAAANDAQQQAKPAIGMDTVAFGDLLTNEMIAARIGNSVTQLTNDGRFDWDADISPSGDLVVWRSCAVTTSNCDIRQAAWTGSSWQVTSLTSNSEPEANPATDGAIVAYDAVRSGESDIYWQPAGGGVEARLELPGVQQDPSISRGVIAFASILPGASQSDLYLYEVATNRIFQVTSTPGFEYLSDLDVLADGRIHVVWTHDPTSPPEQLERDVYGATIELPAAGPSFTFGGFLAPVDARPALNSMKAGAAVPVKFSLGGDKGTAIFAAGYPRSQVIACDSSADVDPIEQTVTAGGSSLSFDPLTGLYTYVWKTDKAWAGTCRQLVLGLADGTFQRANFKFK